MAMSIAGGGTGATVIRCVWRVLYDSPRPGVRSRSRARRIAPVRISRSRRGDARARACTGPSDGDRWVWAVRLRCMMRRRAQLVMAATARARTALAIARGRSGSGVLWCVALTGIVVVLRVHGCGRGVRRGWRCVCSLSISTAGRGRRWHVGS